MASKISDAMRETMEGLNRVIPLDPTIIRRFEVENDSAPETPQELHGPVQGNDGPIDRFDD